LEQLGVKAKAIVHIASGVKSCSEAWTKMDKRKLKLQIWKNGVRRDDWGKAQDQS